MKKSLAFKTILRSPVKTLLTFLLVAAASFALFSRVTDYVITSREAARAQSMYHGVAALDNSVEPIIMDYEYFEPDPKPWPTDEQLEEFASLPGVTLADIRYVTDGLVEDYKRVLSDEDSWMTANYVVEGTYDGYEEYDGEQDYSKLYLVFKDVKVYAGDIDIRNDEMKVLVQFEGDIAWKLSEKYSRSYFDALEKGKRYLSFGSYSERTGTAFELGEYMAEHDCLRMVDGLGDDYLETEEFSYYKGLIESVNQSMMTYDMVYTSDMRAIPYVNEHTLLVSKGRPLTAEDTDSCVVSELFLETYGLSVGDKINVKLGDRHAFSGILGTRARAIGDIAEFNTSVELEIIGAYRYNNDDNERMNDFEWRFGPGTIFLHRSLLPVEIPKDYEISMGQFSVFIEDPNDIESFLEKAQPMAADLNLAMRFSDGGWAGMKDSIGSGSLTSLLTTVLYVLGAALALFLAAYLYIGRNRKSYAIMRTLGVPGKKAGNSIVMPLVVLSVAAVAVGGLTGLFYTSSTVRKALEGMADSSMPEGVGYVPDVAVPIDAVILCLVLELMFIFLLTLFFVQRMKKTPPLELLHEEAGSAIKRGGIFANPIAAPKPRTDVADTAPVPAGLNLAKLSAIEAIPARGKYNAFHQVITYILRHMRRSIGKTAVSLILTLVLAAGIGTFVMAKLAYQDACREMEVKGRANEFASTSIAELLNSDLVKDVYYYHRFDVRINAIGVRSAITFTNNLDRYLINGCKITYAEGYDSASFEEAGGVCLLDKELFEELGIALGDTITMMSDDLYNFMPQVYEEDRLEAAIQRAGKPYKVVGVLETEDEDRGVGVFTVINDAAQNLYGQPFPVSYCEYTLADNQKLSDLESSLDQWRKEGMQYAQLGSFRVDSEPLKNARRVRDLLESLFPIAVAAAVLIGLFGPGLVILQLAREAAFLRILGVTKKRARCILLLEQIFLCIVGIILVALILAVFGSGLFVRGMETLAICWLLYFLACICGALAAAIQVTRYKVLELLQVKE